MLIVFCVSFAYYEKKNPTNKQIVALPFILDNTPNSICSAMLIMIDRRFICDLFEGRLFRVGACVFVCLTAIKMCLLLLVPYLILIGQIRIS